MGRLPKSSARKHKRSQSAIEDGRSGLRDERFD